MNRNEATALAVKILQTFNGPPTDVWEEELTRLDAGRAGTAYARLRRDHDQRWLSIAHFMHAYRAIQVDDTATRRDPCGDCDSTGWIEAPERIWEDKRTSTQCKPCPHCPEGQHAAGSRIWTERNPTNDHRRSAA